MNNRILLVRVPETEITRLQKLRDCILESLSVGVLVLPEDAACEVMELPSLSGVKLESERDASVSPPPEPDMPASTEAEEKRIILQRLKTYRAANGLGSFSALSIHTARRKDSRLSEDLLRDVCAGAAPKMEIADWRKISRALDKLEEEAHG